MGDESTGLFGRTGGFLSKRSEWHALAIGAFFGFVTGLTLRPEVAAFFALTLIGAKSADSPHFEDTVREAAYACGAFVVLAIVGVALRLTVVPL